MFYAYGPYANGWHVFDTMGCEMMAFPQEEAEFIAKYFNDNNISGRGLIDDHLVAARKAYFLFKKSEIKTP